MAKRQLATAAASSRIRALSAAAAVVPAARKTTAAAAAAATTKIAAASAAAASRPYYCYPAASASLLEPAQTQKRFWASVSDKKGLPGAFSCFECAKQQGRTHSLVGGFRPFSSISSTGASVHQQLQGQNPLVGLQQQYQYGCQPGVAGLQRATGGGGDNNGSNGRREGNNEDTEDGDATFWAFGMLFAIVLANVAAIVCEMNMSPDQSLLRGLATLNSKTKKNSNMTKTSVSRGDDDDEDGGVGDTGFEPFDDDGFGGVVGDKPGLRKRRTTKIIHLRF